MQIHGLLCLSSFCFIAPKCLQQRLLKLSVVLLARSIDFFRLHLGQGTWHAFKTCHHSKESVCPDSVAEGPELCFGSHCRLFSQPFLPPTLALFFVFLNFQAFFKISPVFRCSIPVYSNAFCLFVSIWCLSFIFHVFWLSCSEFHCCLLRRSLRSAEPPCLCRQLMLEGGFSLSW